jgi:hypothetical protein
MMANLLMASGAADGAAIWEVEDEQLLAAARRLINRNSGRVMTGVEPEAAPERGGVKRTAESTPSEPPRQVS